MSKRGSSRITPAWSWPGYYTNITKSHPGINHEAEAQYQMSNVNQGFQTPFPSQVRMGIHQSEFIPPSLSSPTLMCPLHVLEIPTTLISDQDSIPTFQSTKDFFSHPSSQKFADLGSTELRLEIRGFGSVTGKDIDLVEFGVWRWAWGEAF